MPNPRHNQYNQPQDHQKPPRNQRKFSRDFVPWICAALSGVLSAWTAYLQAQSKDLLPTFVMGPAIIGAVCSALAGISCVGGYFVLKKGDNYHQKHVDRNPDVQKRDLKHQKHPIHLVAVAIMILGMSAFLTVGAYYYMVACILIDDSDSYCLSISPATSHDECNKSVSFMAIGAGVALLIALSGFAWKFHDVIDEGKSWFNFQRQYHGLDTDGEDDQGGSYGGGSRRKGQALPPSYDTTAGGQGYDYDGY
ncbi:hypothetical protein JCM11251_005476 [Rhodosporidiobolus azoricus]